MMFLFMNTIHELFHFLHVFKFIISYIIHIHIYDRMSWNCNYYIE